MSENEQDEIEEVESELDHPRDEDSSSAELSSTGDEGEMGQHGQAFTRMDMHVMAKWLMKIPTWFTSPRNKWWIEFHGKVIDM